ncbi:hypothetical protein TNCV_2569761 [Trichonephila clavipes]|nr:hypothetical protein TNCV_2569761 [Trichonephila clavipes]
MAVSLEHLVRYHEDGYDFPFRIVTWEESWVYHFTPEVKVTLMVSRKALGTPGGGAEDHSLRTTAIKTSCVGELMYVESVAQNPLFDEKWNEC